AEAQAVSQLATAADAGAAKFISTIYADRDAAYIKLVAQKAVAAGKCAVVLGATGAQPALVLAQTPGLPLNCGQMLKTALQEVGGRGGGASDFAQGGTPDAATLRTVIDSLSERVQKILAG